MNAMNRALLGLILAASPSVALAADAGAPTGLTAFGLIFNFAVYLFVIIYFGRKPFLAFLAERKSGVTAAIDEATRRRESAQATLAEQERKAKGIPAEREALLAEARRAGENEKARTLEAAAAQATKIRRDAEVAAAEESRQLSVEIRQRLVDRAMALAEAEIARRLDETAQRRLLDHGINGLGRAGGSQPTV